MPDLATSTTTTAIAGRLRPILLRNILKEATAADHTRLDEGLGAFDLHDIAAYRGFLAANAAALLPLEGALVAAGVSDILPDWKRRARSRSILGDLNRIGGTTRLLKPPVLNGRSALLGTLYVLEGSRLGAAHLLKRARNSGDPRIAAATGYLSHGVGEQFWRSFLDVLENHAHELRDSDDIIRPARRAFDLFAQAADLS